jgi:pimeloyl-ACP methyl ester carboxylesterase
MEGAQISQRARDYLSENWNGEVFMAVGVKDPVLGLPVMQNLRKIIHNCPKPLEFKDAGHFIQEWGEVVAIEALTAFKLI